MGMLSSTRRKRRQRITRATTLFVLLNVQATTQLHQTPPSVMPILVSGSSLRVTVIQHGVQHQNALFHSIQAVVGGHVRPCSLIQMSVNLCHFQIWKESQAALQLLILSAETPK